ncbi:uncharacterized protein LOC129789496 [Lutzomyia longipalpis]|uniref:uncharacterized protein LOC129789496 n=1 Tax=Lutzomyia longipalpis TaxID=7200 RepID=UPI002483BC89|nr:uncharacterized protein LOC129789496 [Lutzomyia longipalpis]
MSSKMPDKKDSPRANDFYNLDDFLFLFLLAKLNEMKDTTLFFDKNFAKNYVPEYVNSAFTCKDTKTIMTSIEKGSYLTVSAIVKDLADIVYDAKSFLKVTKR